MSNYCKNIKSIYDPKIVPSSIVFNPGYVYYKGSYNSNVDRTRRAIHYIAEPATVSFDEIEIKFNSYLIIKHKKSKDRKIMRKVFESNT